MSEQSGTDSLTAAIAALTAAWDYALRPSYVVHHKIETAAPAMIGLFAASLFNEKEMGDE